MYFVGICNVFTLYMCVCVVIHVCVCMCSQICLLSKESHAGGQTDGQMDGLRFKVDILKQASMETRYDSQSLEGYSDININIPNIK